MTRPSPGTFAGAGGLSALAMPSRPLSLVLAVAALSGCKNSRPEGPEPGPPAAELLGAFDPAALAERPEVRAGEAVAAPAVIDYGPQGRTDGGADIKVRFDRPVVALGGEDVPGLDGTITLAPAVKGRTFFQTPDLLVFRPDEELTAATTYTVKFAPGLPTHDGQRVERGAEWTFETPRPRVVDGTPVSRSGDGERDMRRDSHVIVEFDQPVELAQVRAHLRASARPLAAGDGPGTPVALRITPTTRKEGEDIAYYHDFPADERRYYTVRAQGLWPAASEITVAAVPGLRGAVGPLPLDTPWDMSFATYGPQAVVERACGGGGCGLEDIGLSLRNPVRAGEARKISIAPKPAHLAIEIADAYGDSAGTEVAIRGQFIPGTTYTVRVDPGLKDIYGQRFPGGFEQRVVFERRPEASLSTSHGTLIPARKQTFGVETRFVRALRVRHAVLAEEELIGRAWTEVPLPATAKQRRIELTPKGPTGWASIEIDVADLTGGARGPVLIHVEVDELSPGTAGARPETLRAMFRLTDLGPVAIGSPTTSLVQVLRLSDSAPVAGAKVSLFEREKDRLVLRELGTTDRDGALTFAPAPAAGRSSTGALLVVDPATGDRTTLTIGHAGSGEPDEDGRRPGERTLTQVVTDRGAYRPGETVKVVGWSALDTPFARSGLGRLPKGTAVQLTLIDPYGAPVAERAVKTSEEGKYWAELAIPPEGKLGRYTVAAKLPGGQAGARVEVEDFRTPEFSVTASVAAHDLLIGEKARLRVAASYYFGGGVPIARLTANASCTPAAYRPPGLDATWSVGGPSPGRGGRSSGRVVFGADPAAKVGYREVEVATEVVSADYPHRCTISADVQDASNQGIGAETGVLLHPAPFYLALGVPRTGLGAGDRAAIAVRAVDIAGARVASPGAKVMVVRTWHEATEKAEGGRQVFAGWVEKHETVKTCTATPTATGDDPRCELRALKAGTYTVTATAETADRRKAISEARFWVAAEKLEKWVAGPAPSRLSVQASASRVKPGEAVEVAVQAPWQGGRGLLVLDRRGVRDMRAFALEGAPASFRFAADDTWTPTVHVRAFAVRPLAQTRSKVRPEVEQDALVIDQDAEHRRLAVRVEAPAQAGPGDRIELTAHVRDAAGSPVAGRVALWAVDEAVLALTDYAVPDLLPGFLPGREAAAQAYDDYRSVLMPYVRVEGDPWMASGWGYGRGSGAGFGSRSTRTPSVRQGMAQGATPARERFETTPVFLADIAADASGTARAKAALPDNLTTFRIFAVASARLVDGTSPGRFGVGDARTTVTTPLIVRAAAPRQLRPGDVAEVRAIVQNFTAVDGRAKVELVAHDDPKTEGQELAVMSEKTAEIDVPAGGQAFVPFKIRADGRGAARLELRATLRSGESTAGRDAVKVALPIEPERTLTEKVAIYGSLADDRAVAIPVVLPGAIRPEVGGVSVSASSSLLGGLEDAVGALVTYPYGCVEQTSSRLLPVVALAELHKTYPLGLDEDPREYVKAGVERLLAMQTNSGGFAYWPGGQVVHPYASAYATWVLTLADRAGHKVPADALARALDALAGSLAEKDLGGSRWSDERMVRHAIGLHVLAEVDRADRGQLDALWLRRADLPAFGRAFLLMAMHRADPQRPEVQQLIGELTGDVQELPATAHVIERGDRDWEPFFHSDGRSDAIVLAALLRARPEHPLVEKLARGLLERRIRGKWRNTQENAYALVALAEYARVREAVPPDFVGRAWVGRKPVFEASFIGRDLATRSATAAMPEILRPTDAAERKPQPLTVVLQRAGQGRMYYRLGAEWAPADPSPPAREHGLRLERTLRLQDGPLGARAIGVGETVAVELTLTAATRIRYVALDVPIPAGLEPIQIELGKGQRASTLAGSRGWWVSHQELRRDRVLVFADDLPPGTHHHTVSLRATSRGEYQLPPARTEAMYMPEVWGRSAGARVAVQ